VSTDARTPTLPLGLVASIARFLLNEAWYLPEYSHDPAQAPVLEPRAFGGFPHPAPSPHRLNRHVLRARFVGIAGFLGLKKKAQVLSEPSLVLQMPRLGGLVDSLKRLYSTAPPAQRIPGNSLVLVGSGGTPAAAPPPDHAACAVQTLFALSSRQT
jgi:hypothetical protein